MSKQNPSSGDRKDLVTERDMDMFERAMRLKLGLKSEPSNRESKKSEIPWRDRSPANAWFAEIHPDYDDETLERLAQEF